MDEQSLATLESQVERLVRLCGTLRSENEALKLERTSWQAERAQLVARHELAMYKIDAMIERLRALDETAEVEMDEVPADPAEEEAAAPDVLAVAAQAS